MAKAPDIDAKHTEFQAAVAALDTATDEYELARVPYLEKKAALVAAIDRVDVIDGELEELTQAYEPPEKPEAQ